MHAYLSQERLLFTPMCRFSGAKGLSPEGPAKDDAAPSGYDD